MRNKNTRILFCICVMVGMLFCLGGCATKQNEQKEQPKEQAEQGNSEEQPYLILEHNTENQTLQLYSYADGKEHEFTYAMSTLFKDKYDNITTNENFSTGKIVILGKQDTLGHLLEVKISPDVWSYENISRFSINQEKGIFTIADTKYAITSQTMAFSNGEQIAWADISQEDTLSVIGAEKKVLSVVVTKGQGTLALTNTELFEDSFLQLNTNIFAIITENMIMELPEGGYTLKVANNGWGGSSEIEIVRGETTTVDLDTLKGEGYKKGMITFEIDTEDVTIQIDGKKIDTSEPIELVYGMHSIVVEADGYQAWEKYLNVNSKEATIEIELEEKSEKAPEAESEKESESEKKESEENEDEDENEKDTEKVLEGMLNELLQSDIITGN